MRTLMAASGLPDSYWEEALYASNELRNMLPTADLLSTPYESFLGKRPNVSRLRTFGCLVYLHVPKETRTKMEPRAIKGASMCGPIRGLDSRRRCTMASL